MAGPRFAAMLLDQRLGGAAPKIDTPQTHGLTPSRRPPKAPEEDLAVWVEMRNAEGDLTGWRHPVTGEIQNGGTRPGRAPGETEPAVGGVVWLEMRNSEGDLTGWRHPTTGEIRTGNPPHHQEPPTHGQTPPAGWRPPEGGTPVTNSEGDLSGFRFPTDTNIVDIGVIPGGSVVPGFPVINDQPPPTPPTPSAPPTPGDVVAGGGHVAQREQLQHRRRRRRSSLLATGGVGDPSAMPSTVPSAISY